MPTDQQAQALNQFVSQPVNNLIVFLAIISLVIVILVGFALYKITPWIINLFKQQADTNAKLTEIVGQNSKQAETNNLAVEKNTAEMVRQTAAIEAQTGIIARQGHDLILVSDTLSAHGTRIETNTENIAALQRAIEGLPEQIRSIITDKSGCLRVETLISNLREEVLQLIEQQKLRKTGEIKRVENNETVPNQS